jgi:hypothetical protein
MADHGRLGLHHLQFQTYVVHIRSKWTRTDRWGVLMMMVSSKLELEKDLVDKKRLRWKWILGVAMTAKYLFYTLIYQGNDDWKRGKGDEIDLVKMTFKFKFDLDWFLSPLRVCLNLSENYLEIDFEIFGRHKKMWI